MSRHDEMFSNEPPKPANALFDATLSQLRSRWTPSASPPTTMRELERDLVAAQAEIARLQESVAHLSSWRDQLWQERHQLEELSMLERNKSR